jgi:integrase
MKMGVREMITKTGKRYRAEAMINGRRCSQTFKRKNDAEIYHEGLLAMRVRRAGTNQYEDKLLLGKAWTELVYEKEHTENRDACTVKGYINSSRPFQHLFERDVTDIANEEFIEAFKVIRNAKNGNALSQSHLKAFRDNLCSVLRKAVDMGFKRPGIETLFKSLTSISKDMGTRKKKNPPYTQKEVDKLISTVPENGLLWPKLILLMLLITGSRISEILGISRDKISFDNNTIDIDQMISKGLYHDHLKLDAPPYTIEMDENLRNIVLDLIVYNDMRGLGHQPWLFPSPHTKKNYRYSEFKDKEGKHFCNYSGKTLTREIIERQVKNFMRLAGVPIKNLHNARKTSCTLTYIRFANNRMVDEICRRKMNHKSAQTTHEFYIEVPDSVLNEEMGDSGISDILEFKKPVSKGTSNLQTVSDDDIELLEKKKELLRLEIEIAEHKKKKA